MSDLRFVDFDALTDEELNTWHSLRDANPLFDSPFFHPSFAAAVHATGPTVQVVVVRDGDSKISALLPVHRRGSRLIPAGSPGADFQGPVVAAGSSFPVLSLLAGGTNRFEFDHLIDGLVEFEPWIESRSASPFVDVSGGLDGYLARASRSGKDNMGQARRRLAKAQRTLGEVQFAADSADAAALTRVVELKRAQYLATGVRDRFANPARSVLLNRLLQTRDASFGGILTTLHVGPNLVAAHFGMRSGGVLHWWFPVYDPAFARLSPGWMLLYELVAAAPALGITRIDFGRGDDEYKRRAKTGETLVCQGFVTRSTTRKAFRRARNSATAAARSSPLAPALRDIRRIARRARSVANRPWD